MSLPYKIAGGFLTLFAFDIAVPAVNMAIDGEYGLAILTAAFAALLAFGAWKCFTHKKSAQTTQESVAQALLREAEGWLSDAKARGRFDACRPAQAILGKGEFAVLCQNTSLHELVAERATVGAGTRINIGGLPIFLGGSKPISSQEWKPSAKGELVLTNRRLMFVGNARQITIHWDNLAGIETLTDGFRISASDKAKPVLFTVPNGILWSAALRLLAEAELTENTLPQQT